MPNSSQKLSRYSAKRNPATTNEPFGAEPTFSGDRTGSAFVVHLHDARRRHYDLRLEVDGVLKSFAVPRGPSLDPRDRRLAVQTEDHPTEYLTFEAVIPAGNYGAGPMIVWDSGSVHYLDGSPEEALRRGKLDFQLTGHKLRGRFALVRARQPETDKTPSDWAVHGDEPEPGGRAWLLLKKQDEHAREVQVVDELPRSVVSGLTVDELRNAEAEAERLERRAAALGAIRRELDAASQVPMLCTSAEHVRDRDDVIYELKLDGFRILAEKKGAHGELYYRGQGPAGAAFPEVLRAVQALPVRRVVLDGELVSLDETGRPNFERLLARTGLRRKTRRPAEEGPSSLRYVVFDILALGPYDLRAVPLIDRKALLAELVRGEGILRALHHVKGSSRALLQFCEQQNLEGIVAKRAASPYVDGPRRSGEWIKVKRVRDEEFVVVGMTVGTGARAQLGALDVASYVDGEFVLCGRVGSGLDDRAVRELVTRLTPLVSPTATANGEPEPAPRGRVWVHPEIVVNVRFSGFTEQGRLRHTVFRGVRDGVSPTACVTSPARVVSLLPAHPAEPPPPPADASSSSSHSARRVRVSNPNKLFWPDDRITKRDLCTYYEQVASFLLPYLRDRPVVLVRHPDGIAGKSFYQWNIPVGTPSWIRTIPVARDEDGGRTAHCFLINDPETLQYVANLGCIPIHVLAARAGSLDRCDFLTFDFDIGEQPFADAVTLALSLHALLRDIGLSGYPKTSGQSGLHVLVPLGGGVTFAVARVLVELLGRLLEQRHARIATMERRVQERGPRVYIDTGQTGRSRTIVAPYSVRAQAGAPVSTPLIWDEVTADLNPRGWSIRSLPARMSALGTAGDPMANLLIDQPDVGRAVSRLEAKLKHKPTTR